MIYPVLSEQQITFRNKPEDFSKKQNGNINFNT